MSFPKEATMEGEQTPIAISMVELDSRLAQGWSLRESERAHFGNLATPADERARYFRLGVADRPFACNLRQLAALWHKELPPDLASLHGDLHLIFHAVSVIAAKHPERVAMLGYQAACLGLGTTIDLYPNMLFGPASFGESSSSGLQFTGRVGGMPPAGFPHVSGEQEEFWNFGMGMRLRSTPNASGLGEFLLPVLTRNIQAVGHASSTVSWQLEKDTIPLVGTQVLVQTLLVPHGQKSIGFKMRAFAVISRGWFSESVRIETGEVRAQVDLPDA
jgi:hypothetical protein